MTRNPVAAAASRLAVLSYHSWDTQPEALVADIRALRRDGWRFISAREAVDFVHGQVIEGDARLALVTTDDGHPEDVEFRDALRAEGCPGITFVNVGRMEPERLEWCRRTHSDEWSVQDHGPLHRRHFVSGHITDIYRGQKLGGLDYLGLSIGAPILASTGQLASPRFDPNPDAMALAAEWARVEGVPAVASEPWMAELAARLGRERLAYKWRGRIYLVGTLESREDFERRVQSEVHAGRRQFESSVGHSPTIFAYPWWQSSRFGDRAFEQTGYLLTFAGTGRLQGTAMSPYSIPRVVMDPTTPRPVSLDAIPVRARRDWSGVRGHVERAAKRLMGVI